MAAADVVKDYTMYIKKIRDGATLHDIAIDFGIVITQDVTPLDGGEAKPSGSQDFPDIHGTDAYDADEKFIKPFDVEIPFACKGSTPAECRGKKVAFINYLLGNGAEKGILHKIYIPWLGQGRNNVEYKSESSPRFSRDINGDSVFTFKLKFTINDPVSEVFASL